MTYDVLRNVTYDVTFNETYNVTYNTTINVTEYVNVTTEVTSTYNVTSQQPVDVVVALDASWSVSDADWAVENTAGRELLRGLRNTLASDLRAGVAVWANDGVMRQALTHVDDEATIDAMADVQRLPYCVAVPEPHSARAEQFSSHLCEGDPPRVQDEDHAYDLRHDAAQDNASRVARLQRKPMIVARSPSVARLRHGAAQYNAMRALRLRHLPPSYVSHGLLCGMAAAQSC